ncbi:MAG: cation diffusion facilitator family transporter [Bacteroidales bacterium]|jgi:cation diffusion facilitator family transporter|nr:cation diffusion facilitator family transporter [Bacteroidales bacterium]
MDKAKAGYVEGIVSILINSALFIAKMWAGIITGSIALTADAWHTLSDSISSVIIVVAVKLSSKKADKKHPFGHGRWEQIAAIFIAVVLGIIAYDFLKNSIIQFHNKEKVEYGTIAIIVTAVSIVVKELLAQYAFYVGRKTENVSIRADGWHHRTDALSSVVVLAGILFAKQCWWIDSVLGICIALMLFYATFEIMKEAITKLLGEEPGEELIEKINAEVRQLYNNDLSIHHFHLHNYVLHKELTLHIRLDKNLSIENGHKIATVIEKMIKEKFDIEATIHVEPLD